MNKQRAITGGLILLLMLLSWDFTQSVILYDPLEATGTTAPSAAATARTTEPELTMSRPAWGDEILTYNLFSKSRGREMPLDSAETTDISGSGGITGIEDVTIRPDVKLSGIIKNQFGEFVAYIKVEKDPPVAVRTGEVVRGMKIMEIRQRSVTVEWKGSNFDLNLNIPLLKR